MKKKIIILSIIILIVIIPITINKINKEVNKSYTIETYIDGKLAASLPSSGSEYIVDNITCTNGARGTFNYSTWRVEVTNISSKTKCTVKFKSSASNSFAEYLVNKKCDPTPTTDEEAKDCLVDENETTDGTKNYRYEGSNPNNYVLFNDELWRIIGVFNVETESNGKQDLVKLIRAQALDGLVWDSSSKNDWETASLQKILNEKYINAIDDSECYVHSTTVKKTCYFSETGIKNGAREKIEAVKWNIGKPKDCSNVVNSVYETETETPTTNYYKAGLMNASDYGYAVLEESCSRITKLCYYDKSTCAGSNWLMNGGSEFTLTAASGWQTVALGVGNDGSVDNDGTVEGYGARPSIYLKSTVQYVKGSGTYFDPYIIS